MDKYPQFKENYPKEDDNESIRKWASGILNLLNNEEISINTIREFRDNMYQLIRKNTPTTDTEKIMLKIVNKLNTIIPPEDKRSNSMLCISIDTYIVHILYEHVLKESVI